LNFGFVTLKRQNIFELSASDDVFVMIQSMAKEDQTLSKSMFESLLTQSEALKKESSELSDSALAKMEKGEEDPLDWQEAIACQDSSKRKKEEGSLLKTKFLALVEARKSTILEKRRGEADLDMVV
jgi:hypothetical protein